MINTRDRQTASLCLEDLVEGCKRGPRFCRPRARPHVTTAPNRCWRRAGAGERRAGARSKQAPGRQERASEQGARGKGRPGKQEAASSSKKATWEGTPARGMRNWLAGSLATAYLVRCLCTYSTYSAMDWYRYVGTLSRRRGALCRRLASHPPQASSWHEISTRRQRHANAHPCAITTHHHRMHGRRTSRPPPGRAGGRWRGRGGRHWPAGCTGQAADWRAEIDQCETASLLFHRPSDT